MGRGSVIKALFQGTPCLVGASVTDIRGLFQPQALLPLKVLAVAVALSAEGALSLFWGRALGAEGADGTVPAVGAGIEGAPIAAGLFKEQVCADLPGDRGAVLAHSQGNLFE